MKKRLPETEIICPDCGQRITDAVTEQIEKSGVRLQNRSTKGKIILSVVAVILIAAIAVSLTILIPKIKYKEEDEMAEKAIELLTEAWEDVYGEREDFINFDKIIIIKNTRIIKIKNNDSEIFKDVEYVMEFDVLNDYYGSAPYYVSYGPRFVMFYKNGKAEVYSGADPFNRETSITYDIFLKHIVDEVVDLEDRYNQTIEID